MNPDDLTLISVDDHVNEPSDLFEHHLPPSFLGEAPRVVRRTDGSDWWVFQGQEIAQGGIFATVGKPPEEWSVAPASFDDIRPGCYDVHERVRDMDAGGVLASLCFPSFPGFAGRVFARADDKELALALVRAYNDWHIDEWAGSYPGRFIPIAIPPMWDPQLMAAEVRRVAAKGCHAFTFTEAPDLLGLPSYHSGHWDPFFTALCDEGSILCIHLGSSGKIVDTSPDAPLTVLATLQPMHLSKFAAELLWSPVLLRFPALKIALSEGGLGWIPYFLERADWVYSRQARMMGVDFGGRRPSDVFREHVVTCFIDDPSGIRLRDQIGIDAICWEQDYPHSDSLWPHGPEAVAAQLHGCTLEEVAKITHRNAMRHFRLDPYAHRPPEACTVGALRARASDVDLTWRSAARAGRGNDTLTAAAVAAQTQL